MGILNVTSDSFFDGGAYTTLDSVKLQVEKMIYEGVDIIDVGGASSRPGADEVSVQEELDRVLPIIEFLHHHYPTIPISIDTYRAQVASDAVSFGAAIINDISAGDDDVDMLATVGRLKVPYIAMHKKGSPKTMQNQPTYTNVLEEVVDYFDKKMAQFKQHQIIDVILDPGFGFGKTVNHNYILLRYLDTFQRLLKRPALVGFSRKSMINKVLGTNPAQALNGTTVLNTLALEKGANILRVHDVLEAKQAVTLVQAYRKGFR